MKEEEAAQMAAEVDAMDDDAFDMEEDEEDEDFSDEL